MDKEGKRSERGAGKEPEAGLCTDCAQARRMESSRGSVFILCERSATDPSYAKYPRLPVKICAGYIQKRQPTP